MEAMQPFPPIFIPSRGRWRPTKGTVSLFMRSLIPFHLVVEPHEVVLYTSQIESLAREHLLSHADASMLVSSSSSSSSSSVASSDSASSPVITITLHNAVSVENVLAKQFQIVIHPLPLSNQGISFVRNHILQVLAPRILAEHPAALAAECSRMTHPVITEGLAYFQEASDLYWVMDDDIRGFHCAGEGVNHAIGPRALFQLVESRIAKNPEATLFSIDYPFYAWQYGNDDVAINSYNNIAILVRYSKLPPGIHYRFRIREDYDFTLQIIAAGGTTIRFRNLSYNVPSMAVADGGMTEYYAKQQEDIKQQNQEFIQMWPSVSREVIKGIGKVMRADINVKWFLLNPKRNNGDPVAILRSTERFNQTPTKVRDSNRRSRAAPAATTSKGGSRKRPRRRRRDSDDDDSDTTDDDDDDEAALNGSDANQTSDDDDVILVEPPKKKARLPRPPAPPREKVEPGWKGFRLADWRDVPDEMAAEAGLQRLDPLTVKPGSVVAMIPYDLSLPSLVTVIIVEISQRKPHFVWSGVVEKIKGANLQTVERCFAVPEDVSSMVQRLNDLLDDAQMEQEATTESLHTQSMDPFLQQDDDSGACAAAAVPPI